MNEQTVIRGVLIDEDQMISFVEVCQRYHIDEQDLIDFIEHGLFGDGVFAKKQAQFNKKMIDRICMAQRLRHDLEVNLPGAILALELLDELQQLRNEIAILHRHVDKL